MRLTIKSMFFTCYLLVEGGVLGRHLRLGLRDMLRDGNADGTGGNLGEPQVKNAGAERKDG
jgi:hypothetical protein